MISLNFPLLNFIQLLEHSDWFILGKFSKWFLLHRMDLTINSKLSWPICGCPEITQELNLSRHSFPGSYFCRYQLSGRISNESNSLPPAPAWELRVVQLLLSTGPGGKSSCGVWCWLCPAEERLGSISPITWLGSRVRELRCWSGVTPVFNRCKASEESDLINSSLTTPQFPLCLV